MDGRGTYGSLLRDEDGAWIWGFARQCAAQDPLETELKAIYHSLFTLVEKNSSRVLIEFDFSTAVNLIHGYPDDTHMHLHLILECKRLHRLLLYSHQLRTFLTMHMFMHIMWLDLLRLFVTLFTGIISPLL